MTCRETEHSRFSYQDDDFGWSRYHLPVVAKATAANVEVRATLAQYVRDPKISAVAHLMSIRPNWFRMYNLCLENHCGTTAQREETRESADPRPFWSHIRRPRESAFVKVHTDLCSQEFDYTAA